MRLIKLTIVVLLCTAASACAPKHSTQDEASAREVRRQALAECRKERKDQHSDGDCAKAIADRDKAAWESKGRGIRLKPEVNR